MGRHRGTRGFSTGSVLAVLLAVLLAATARPAGAQDLPTPPMRVGVIGVDTSHAVAFAKAMNAPEAKGALAEVQVVAAYPIGSPDLPSSADRIEGFTEQLRQMGITIVPDLPTLLSGVDAVLVESVDGRPHLAQARAVIEAGKPLFVDKPVAASLEDVKEIYRLAAEHEVPCFSSSALRFCEGIAGAASDPKIGEVRGCDAWGPCTLDPTHPDLFWYGIHGVETLFTIMGPGCLSVTRTQTDGTELVTGVWQDGRIGTFRGLRDGKRDYGAMVFGAKSVAPSGGFTGYGGLVEAIAVFFRTGVPPVAAAETIEIYAFMEAAHESLRREGRSVGLAEVMER